MSAAEAGATVTTQAVSAWLREFAVEAAANREYLTELDAAIGDADHGINMDRGMQAVAAKLGGGGAVGAATAGETGASEASSGAASGAAGAATAAADARV
jgi:dihydroxyacetone kinase-like protein